MHLIIALQHEWLQPPLTHTLFSLLDNRSPVDTGLNHKVYFYLNVCRNPSLYSFLIPFLEHGNWGVKKRIWPFFILMVVWLFVVSTDMLKHCFICSYYHEGIFQADIFLIITSLMYLWKKPYYPLMFNQGQTEFLWLCQHLVFMPI